MTKEKPKTSLTKREKKIMDLFMTIVENQRQLYSAMANHSHNKDGESALSFYSIENKQFKEIYDYDVEGVFEK